jgi:hypothetical protein
VFGTGQVVVKKQKMNSNHPSTPLRHPFDKLRSRLRAGDRHIERRMKSFTYRIENIGFEAQLQIYVPL